MKRWLRRPSVRRSPLMGGVIVLLLGTGGVLAAPAHASRVCIPFLTGTQCVQFLEGRPTKPGLSKGMRISIAPGELTSTNELKVSITGFRPNEGLRRFNYNIFGQNRMNEYSGEFRRADAKGNFSWVVAPSTAVYEPEWGAPAVCVYGQRSKRLACANFSVAADSAASVSPQPSGAEPAPAAPAAPAPAATSPAPATANGGSCIDAGFTVICTG